MSVAVETLSAVLKDPKPYKCTYPGCNKSYKKPSRLDEHERTHINFRPFICPVEGCDKSYFRKSHLDVHLIAHGPTSKPFVCDIEGCGKAYSNRSHLIRHKKTHKVEEYMCNVDGCKQVFESRKDLKTHCRKNHIQDKKKSYQCGQCFTVFEKWTVLQTHMKEIHPLVCDICSRSFTKREAFKSHMLTHDPNRPLFNCDVCEKSYTSKNGLAVHKRTVHEGQKPFVCWECGKGFAHKHLWVRHKRTHNGEEQEEVDEEASQLDEKDTTDDEIVDTLTGDTNYESRKFACGDCNFRFNRQYDLDRHMQAKHSIE